ncbi:MAG: hypothetical protein JRJ20_08685 [Deltaproteobacteria bacterium]|nr:hypothetical protein [Deltaproteobacteria bacterium]
MTSEELERICGNCNYSFPSEPGGGELAICLNDPVFESYLDELLEDQDFSRCLHLVEENRFPWDHKACPEFDPAEIVDQVPEEFADIIEEFFDTTDWANLPVEGNLEDLNKANTPEQQKNAVKSLGVLISLGNKAAFDGLCSFLEALPCPENVEDTHFRVEILRHLTISREDQSKLARLLVKDLFRTPSNNTTRGWYTAVFRFFEQSSADIAEEALTPMLESPQFSYRIKKRIKTILWEKEGFF